MLAVPIRSIWVPTSHRRLHLFQVRVEECGDLAAGMLRGRLVIPGVGDPRQEASDFARLAPGLVREGLPGVRVPAAAAPKSPRG